MGKCYTVKTRMRVVAALIAATTLIRGFGIYSCKVLVQATSSDCPARGNQRHPRSCQRRHKACIVVTMPDSRHTQHGIGAKLKGVGKVVGGGIGCAEWSQAPARLDQLQNGRSVVLGVINEVLLGERRNYDSRHARAGTPLVNYRRSHVVPETAEPVEKVALVAGIHMISVFSRSTGKGVAQWVGKSGISNTRCMKIQIGILWPILAVIAAPFGSGLRPQPLLESSRLRF